MTITGSALAGCALGLALPALAAAQNIEAEVISLAEWNYENLYASGLSIDEMLDADVVGPTGEEIGEVENVLFSADGEILSVVAEVGGFIDIGDTHVSVPWEKVDVSAGGDEIAIPVTQETVEEYTLFQDGFLTSEEVTEGIQRVEGNGWGTVDTGPRVWRAAELIGDYARLTGDGTIRDYGYVDDIIVQDGRIAAVVVSPDVTWGTPGYYAYPYYGVGYGWGPAYGYYDLPYTQDEVAGLNPLEDGAFD